ncbi:hypothetical protein [Alicyclobacillus sp. ALC3]|uniref:hypothetical protein n=1 Tax=Alicyclobacillus sp. ALC3 TaxID=2796143 RepID=UPI0023793D6A|nr:hypothetical protein [Alicyclobacillus sp. ALC3]WDL97375.1 hypothetical protein JC200_01100 [Alicyclobacillus sp. ALC3]
MKSKPRTWLLWLGYLLWAVFVNAVNVWILTPIVEDYGILGVVGVVLISTVWLLGLPTSSRRRWVIFTMFALLVGQGLSDMANSPSLRAVALAVVMCLGLIALAAWVGKVRMRHLVVTAVAMSAISAWLPFSEWPYFTRFVIVSSGNLPVSSTDFQSLPLAAVQTPQGQAVVTVKKVRETTTGFTQRVMNATASTDQLQNVLTSYNHLYELVSLSGSNSRVGLRKPTPQELSAVNPITLDPQFPFTLAHWSVSGGRVYESFTPVLTPDQIAKVGLNPTAMSSELVVLSKQVQLEEQSNWDQVLSELGVSPRSTGLQVVHGVLQGTSNGLSVHVKTGEGQVIGFGHFTNLQMNQVLFEGLNTLKVISLANGGAVVATYQGNAAHPLSTDVIIGALDASGRNVVFVNSSPAIIIQANSNGTWKQVYQAPNRSLRFEASVLFSGDKVPEILTNDISLMQPSTIRYFTSYSYQNGSLVRNWRVYRPGIAKVIPVQFSPTARVPDLLATVSGTGKFVVLKRHDIPVVPIASVLLALIIAGGYALRLRVRAVGKGVER